MAAAPQLFSFRNPFVPFKPASATPETKVAPECRDVRSARQPCHKRPQPASDTLSERDGPKDVLLVPQRWRSCLFVFGTACFVAGHGRQLLQWLWHCLLGGMAADVLFLLCLVALLEPSIKGLLRTSWTKLSPVCTLIFSMPQIVTCMSNQMTAMLDEIQSMHSDVRAMKAKTNWLPGGMVA